MVTIHFSEPMAVVPFRSASYGGKSRRIRGSLGHLGFYPVSTDGLIKAENSRSRRATLRRIRGLWNRSM